MRDKILKRFAAGTVGVLFAYALIKQPFAVMSDPSALIAADWKKTEPTAAVQATQPATSAPTESPTEIFMKRQAQTAAPTEMPTEPPTEAVTEAPEEEYYEEDSSQDDYNDEEWQPEPEQQSGGDVPSLTEFLSTMICGGCRHNCSLVSPRCMKGRSKAESATVEYYEIYGA